MQEVYEIERTSLQKAKESLLGDDIVSRASVTFKEGNLMGLGDKFYCYISGVEEACKKADELLKGIGKKVEEKVKNQVIQKIKEEENRAIEGFGGIFG